MAIMSAGDTCFILKATAWLLHWYVYYCTQPLRPELGGRWQNCLHICSAALRGFRVVVFDAHVSLVGNHNVGF